MLFSLLAGTISAQRDQAIGEWRDHLPYHLAISVSQSDSHIYYATPYSVFSLDKEDGTSTFLSKVNGLSDVGVHQLRYDPHRDQLMIIYQNSNVDVVRGAHIYNIPDIKSNTSITGNKRINDVLFTEMDAYFSTDFGIVILDPETFIFGATIITGMPVYQISVHGKYLYAATSDGVYRVNHQEVSNLADFDLWQYIGEGFGMPEVYESRWITSYQDLVYIGTNDEVFVSDVDLSQWSSYVSGDSDDLLYMKETGGYLVMAWQQPDDNSYIDMYHPNGILHAGPGCSGIPVDIEIDQSERVWYADLFADIRVASSLDEPCDLRSYPSPYSINSSDIAIREDQVLIASGGVAENFTYLYGREGFYWYRDDQWLNFNQWRDPDIASLELLNVFRVAIHPSLPKIYAGSYWAGLLEYDYEADNYTLFNKNNSTLRGALGDPARERITGLAFDDDGHLWVATYGADQPINVYTSDGRWLSFEVPGAQALTNVIIDSYGYKWFLLDGGSAGILIYDSGPSIESVVDDRYRYVTTHNSELTTNRVLSLAMDLDEDVWVGTEEGPVIFNCGSSVVEEDCPGFRIKVIQDSIAAFLLADQQINTIAVDGANQKWFGTRNGLFVQSATGDEQVAHYTSENSSLLNDVITALGYDGHSGTMWIGTDQGIMSLRTEATTGAKRHIPSDVIAYPNPVRPGYGGTIAISGLVTDAQIHITDVNGILVREIQALGGQVIWDGLDQQGRAVSSGVYLVFSIEQDAIDIPDAYVTKVLIVR